MHPNDPAAPFRPETRRRRAVEAIACVLIATVILVAAAGDSVLRAGQQMDPGLGHDVVTTIGHPTGWLADRLPVADAADHATAFLTPDDDLSGNGGFALAAQPVTSGDSVPPVTEDAFDPADLGADPPAPRPLRRLLVTGDSMATPLDAELARRFTRDAGVTTIRDPHLGTGISKSGLVDWGKLADRQSTKDPADAVVIFLGANEGFPMDGRDGSRHECCDAAWAAEYAWRVRLMMDTYRRAGDARVYWLTLPAPRESDRARIARAVNAAIRVAATPYRAHVRVLSMDTLFTPGWRFRDAMPVDGADTLVREADGIHLNGAGADTAADAVAEAISADFMKGDP